MWLGDSQSEASIRWHWPIRGLLRRLWISRVRCRRSKVGELLKQNMIWVDRSDINEVRIWHRSLSRYCDPWITPGMLFMGRLRWPLKNKDKNKTRDFQNILFSPSNFFTHLFSSINPGPARLFSPPSQPAPGSVHLYSAWSLYTGSSPARLSSEPTLSTGGHKWSDKLNVELRSWKLIFSQRHEKLCKAE